MVPFGVRREAELSLGPSELFILEERVARSGKPSAAAEVMQELEMHLKGNRNGHTIYNCILGFLNIYSVFFYLGEEVSFPIGKFPFSPCCRARSCLLSVFWKKAAN